MMAKSLSKQQSSKDKSNNDDAGTANKDEGSVDDIVIAPGKQLDIDPLMNLTADEFILEVAKRCGLQTGEAYGILVENRELLYF